MIDAGKFFCPGPTEVRPEILDAMRRPLIFHRNAEMEALVKRSTAVLSQVFGTTRPVHVLTGSGTSAMEMAIRNGTVHRVLSIVHGDFGERFAKIAESCGRDVVRIRAEPGDVVSLDQIRDTLKGRPFDAVLATHSETALGVLADIKGIGAIVRERPDCLFLVDAVSSAGATAIEADAWGCDAVVSASQKSLALPPGLAFAAVSERLVARARGLKDRGSYLDILKYEDFTAKWQSPTTPAISMLFALDAQMADVARETPAGRYARHAAMAKVCTDWIERNAGLGISIMAKPGHRSPSVTCIKWKGKASDVLSRMRSEGYELGGGQAEFVPTTFRIGHMGDHTPAGVSLMLPVLERVLRSL